MSGNSGNDQANCVWTDTSGNAYVAGETYGSLDGNSNAGQYDIFILKLNSAGIKEWTFQFGGSASEFAHACYFDGSNDDIFLTGHTYSALDGTTFGGADAFAMKVDLVSQTIQWTYQSGSSTNDVVRGIVVDSSGNVILAGETMGDLGGNVNAGGGTWDIFTIKLNSLGVHQWTYQTGSSTNDEVGGIQVDSAANIYVAGDTEGALTDVLPNAGGYDVFFFKLTSAGSQSWLAQTGSTASDFLNALYVESSGNMYLAGSTEGDLHGLSNSGGSDIFAMKIDINGENPVWKWSFQTGSSANDVVRALQTDSNGQVILAGETYGGLDGNSNAGFSTRDTWRIFGTLIQDCFKLPSSKVTREWTVLVFRVFSTTCGNKRICFERPW